jgi:pyruvate formate lyase activating enzyme
MVLDIQKFCTHDGPGIRTTVFLKGCPLRCEWCHNPESQEFNPELFFHAERCIDCRRCEEARPGAGVRQTLSRQGQPAESRRRLIGVEAACPSGAIERVGRDRTVAEVLDIVEQDRPFYEASGGGLTISGGEPLAHPDFATKLAREAKVRHLHVCLETSGCASPAALRSILPYVDLFLWDIKDTDAVRLKVNTGADMDMIEANLRSADAAGAATVLTCLMVPGLNMNEPHYRALAALCRSLAHCRGVRLIPYHPFGASKYTRLGLPIPERRFQEPDATVLKDVQSRLEALGVSVREDLA